MLYTRIETLTFVTTPSEESSHYKVQNSLNIRLLKAFSPVDMRT